MRDDVVEDAGKVHCCDRTQATFTNGPVRTCCEHHEIDDVFADNRVVVAESRKPASFKRTNVATQQFHGIGLSPKALHKHVLGPSAARFPLSVWNQPSRERAPRPCARPERSRAHS